LADEPLLQSSRDPVDPVLVTRAPRLRRRRRRIGQALLKRRRLRVGIVQLLYVAAAVALGLIIPRIDIGSTVPTSSQPL
jgi:hypothetical protein